ncbi:MAG: SGNH/GDSL hydrolase family protein [Myxococcota bacterium]
MTRALAFAAGALALHVALSLLFVATICRDHDVRRMDARWLLGPRPAQVMVAGDSHPRLAVEAPVLGAAINVAVPGEHYEKTTFRVPWLLDHGTRPVETVLLPFDAASFAAFKDDVFEPEAVWGRYVDWAELGARKHRRWDFAQRALKASLAPYVGEWPTVLQYLTASRHFRDPGEAQGVANLVHIEGGVEVARRHFQGADPWNDDMVWAFRRLLDDLRGRGIRVVLVRYPVSRAYFFEAQRLGVDVAKRDALLAEVGAPGVVDHLDFERALFRTPDLFADGDHLNPAGKRQFSRILAERLRALGVLHP